MKPDKRGDANRQRRAAPLTHYVPVVIESPYQGDVEKNEAYARECMHHSILQGEAPFLSHLLYPQVLDESDPVERAIGVVAGFAFHDIVRHVAFYTDLGMSPGMVDALARCQERGTLYEIRKIL